MRTLLAASGGGHLTQLLNLRPRLPFDPGEVTWFTFDTPQSRSMLDGERVVFAHPAPPRDWRAAVRNARLVREVFRRTKFDVAVSTGASVAVSVLPIARRFGARSVYIESAARVTGPSTSGRILSAVPGVSTFCQYRSWATGPWRYAGSVFDSFAVGPSRPTRRLERVVVTLGSQEGYPFDRLVQRLAEVVPSTAEVLWQTGSTDPTRFGIQGVTSMSSADLESAVASSDLVVAHAGVGSAITALLAGRHPLLVPRRHTYGEHVDDHQLQIAFELSRRGLATACAPEEIDLGVLLGAAGRSVVRAENPPFLDLGGEV